MEMKTITLYPQPVDENKHKSFMRTLDAGEQQTFSSQLYKLKNICARMGANIEYTDCERYAAMVVKLIRQHGFDAVRLKAYKEEIEQTIQNRIKGVN